MSRDTDSDWALIGNTEPWYGVLSTEKFLKANLTPEAIEDFYAQGRVEIAEVVVLLKERFGFTRPRVALDFGSGLGRLAFAMREHADCVYGVDVAPGMVREAQHQAALRGVDGVSFVHQQPAGQPLDWINSYIVFQHINPVAGFDLLARLVGQLAPSGHISLHLTYCHDSRCFTLVERDVAAMVFDGISMRVLEENPPLPGTMGMFDYDLNRVMRILHGAQVVDVMTRHTDHGGCHGLWLFGRRSG